MLKYCCQRRRFSFVQTVSLTAILMIVSCHQQSTLAPENNKKPDDNRFTPVVLTADGALDEPMNFEVLKDGRAYVNERKGGLKLVDPVNKTVTLVANIPVNTKYTSAEGKVTEAEEGFVGFTIDPKFDENHWAYLYYAHPTEKKQILSRWELREDKLILGTEKIMLEISTQRETCCHTGGGMTWDDKGNLFLTVGNNTGNVVEKSQTDERPGRSSWDDQRGSANTNDLRGKILRIHPEADGSYSIPDGNLFPKGTPKTRPEIYIMGDRNPWRPSVDSKTGYLYWGEVGPDANADTKTTKTGMDEFNQARGPGNFGWPYFIGENVGYPLYDYVHDTVLGENNPAKPINKSINNTGLAELPPAQPAFISYPYGISEKFPLVGTGARCAVGGPIYHQENFTGARRPFPAYFEGKWIVADLSRGWIMTISMNDKADYQSMEPFLPSYQPIEPIDIKFGPSGDLYVLEYGSNWFRKSDNARLVRIAYNAGNRSPVAAISSSAPGGVLPLQVKLSSAGTKDFDGDSLKYDWKIVPVAGGSTQHFTDSNPSLTLTTSGEYLATLTVTDPQGASNSKSLKIVAGNAPPAIDLSITGNKTFFFPGKPFAYSVKVTDREDAKIQSAEVGLSIDYASEGFDYSPLKNQEPAINAAPRFALARAMINRSDCNNCHHLDSKSIGPMFIEIADKYHSQEAAALDNLSKKIKNGGSGVWGSVNMPAHPAFSWNDSRTMVNYILHSKDKQSSDLPLQGNYSPTIPGGDNGKGLLLIRASYTDHGAKDASPLSAVKLITLHGPQINPGSADQIYKADAKLETMFTVSWKILPKANGYIGFNQLDLTGVKELELSASANPEEGYAGGTIEVRLDQPTGKLLGSASIEAVNPYAQVMTANTVQNAGGAKTPGAKKKTTTPAFNPFSGRGIVLNIGEIDGYHDLYFVFKNDLAKPNQPLLSFSNIRFNDNISQ
jgi:cytochrome c